MIPLKDDLPTRTFPLVTLALIAINVVVFMFEVSRGPHLEAIFFSFGAVPYDLIHELKAGNLPIPIVTTLFTSMFIHGGLLHVGGNMLYLWIFGNNIEDAMGHRRFIFFYLLCGVIAVYSHAILNPDSKVPMVGASGAVSGVLGAYLLLFPRARILTLVPIVFFIQIIRIRAVYVLGFWIIAQFFHGFFEMKQQGGVAWFAHIGGFLAGMILIHFFKKPRPRWKRYL